VDSSEKAIAEAGLTPEDIDLVIPHQANVRIIQAVVERLGIPMERAVVTIDRYGNTSSASIPLAFHAAREEGRIREGGHALLTGFGAGMTWASSVVKWSPGPGVL
jgi:3-oxoacyl-[acyl-carrier-protein] synthase-3